MTINCLPLHELSCIRLAGFLGHLRTARRLACSLLLPLALGAVLSGCAGVRGAGGSSPQTELPTSSDQTDNQKRAQIRLQLAVGYFEQHQLNTALDELKQAITIDPNFADAYSVRALVYMDMGETRLADENFQTAMRLAPNNPDLNNNYGWYLYRPGPDRTPSPRCAPARPR